MNDSPDWVLNELVNLVRAENVLEGETLELNDEDVR